MAQGTYQDFELDVEQDGVKILKASAGTRTRQGEVANPDFDLPADFDLEQLAEIIGETIGQAEGRSSTTLTEGDFTLEAQKNAMAYGQALFSSLFPESSALLNKYIGSYHQAAAVSEGRGVPMRLRLRLRPELASIPWEILSPTANVPGHEQFLAMGMSISRRPPTITGPAEPYEISRPLKMLLVADDAYMEEKERLAQQRDLILEALAPLGDLIVAETLEMGSRDHSTLEAIGRTLQTQEYQILHFMGHGYLDIDQETPIGYLVMTKDGESSAYRDRAVADVFQGGMGKGQGLRLVVLNACEGARGRPQYAGVAQAMLDVGVPAVVAMQNLLSDPAARRFAQSFYPRLAQTLSVDEATRYARERMNRHIVGTMEWSSPVLFFTGDGPLFARPVRPEVSRTVEDPLGAEAVAVREAYLRMVHEVSDVLGDDYLPIQVTRSTSVLQRTTTDGALPQASLYAYPAADARDSAADAIDSLVDRKTRQATQRVNVLLGRPGAGKTTVVNQVVGVLAPDDKEALDELAENPETLIPIRVPMNDVSLEGPADDLALLVFKALARVWSQATTAAKSKAVAESEAMAESEAEKSKVNLPSLESLRGWVSSEAWRFLIIFEEMEEVVPADRRRAGQFLQSFMQRHAGHYYLLTSSRPAFLDYVYYAGAASQWEIASLSRSTVRRALEKAKLDVQQEDMITLLRQPWALVTFIQMHAQGEAILTPADLLRGRVDLLLDKIPGVKQRHQKQRLLETLKRLALDIETLAQDETAEPKMSVDTLFELMAEVRGERAYDLESILAGLIDVGFLRLDAMEECVYFADPHLRAILSAMAMDRRLTPAFLADWKLGQPGSQATLVLLAQLSEGNAQTVVEALLERLHDRDMKDRWDARLELLNLAVQCLAYQKDGRGDELRREVIGELARMFLRPEDEGLLADLDDFSLAGVEQNVCRLPRTTMRIQAVRLLGRLGDARAFELFRWLIVERVRGDESCDPGREPKATGERNRRFARSAVRRAAALSTYELWESGRLAGPPDGDDENSNRTREPSYREPSYRERRYRELLEAWQQGLADDGEERAKALEKLTGWLAPKEEAWFSSIVAVALAEIAARYQLAEGDRAPEIEQVIKVLTSAFTTADEDTRWAIADGADSLSGIASDLAAPLQAILEEVATGRRERDFAHGRAYREPAVYALGKLRSLQSIPTLSQVLTTPEQPAEIMGRAARGLGECSVDHRGDLQVEEALDNLIQAVDSFRLGAGEAWEVSVRAEAIGSLGYIGDQRAVPVLVDVIAKDAHRTSQPARERAALALMQILGREAAAKTLQERLPKKLTGRTLPLTRRLLTAIGEIDLPLAVKALEDGILESWLVAG